MYEAIQADKISYLSPSKITKSGFISLKASVNEITPRPIDLLMDVSVSAELLFQLFYLY